MQPMEAEPSNLSFGKEKKLKSKKQIEQLFATGKRAKKGAVIAIYHYSDDIHSKVGVSVPKRNFKHAVDRNKIKRLLRETYRLNQDLLESSRVRVMFIFRGHKLPDFGYLQNCMRSVLLQIKKGEVTH